MNQLLNNCSAVLNDIGRWFCNYGFDIFIQSGILIILLLIIDFLLRKRVRATFRYWIWMLVLLKLMLPPAISLPTGIGRWFGNYLPALTSVSTQVSNTTWLKPAGASAPQDPSFSGEIPQVHLSQASPEQAAPALPVMSDLQALTWQAVVFVLWFTGAAVLSVLLIHRILFVRRLIARSEPAKNRYVDILDQCRQQLCIKRKPELRLSDKLQSPAVCGFFRPVILIPTGLLKQLSIDKLRAVLIHELAHIKRGDLWINCLQTFLQIIYFYNPLIWFANAVIRRIREQAVDELVLVALGEGGKDYSNTLIDIAEMAFLKTSLSLRLIGVVESRKALRRRIRHMLNRPVPKSAKLGALGLVVVVLTAAVLLPMAKAQKQDPDIVKTEQINSQFTAILPDGVKVELLGVCEHPSEGKQWWRPDGSLLETNLYKFHGRFRTGNENHKSFEVVISVHGTTDTPGIVTYDIGSGFNSIDKAGGIWATIIHVPEKVKATDINLGVAVGQWKNVHEAGRDGMSFASGQGRSYAFSVPFEEEGYLGIVVTHNLDTKNENFRIIAVDRSGQIHTSGHPAGGSLGGWSQYSARFRRLKKDNVKVFKLQTRAYERVIFRNVSLRPDMKTAVRTEIKESNVLRVPLDKDPTIPSNVEAIRGIVASRDGEPIEGATVIPSRRGDNYRASLGWTAKTDNNGRFTGFYEQKDEGKTTTLIVKATGYAPVLREIKLSADALPLKFQLGPGKTIRGLVIDQNGNPVKDVQVAVHKWGEYKIDNNNLWKDRTDSQGRFVWTEAPQDQLEFYTYERNHLFAYCTMSPAEKDYVITLKPAIKVRGKVTDAETDEAIKRFRLIPLSKYIPGHGLEIWQVDAEVYTDGQFEFLRLKPYSGQMIGIEAEGYKAAVSAPLNIQEGELVCDFKLHKANDSNDLTILPDYVEQRKAKDFLSKMMEQPTSQPNQYETILPNGVTVELVGLFTGHSKEDLILWRPDGDVMSQQEYAHYEGRIRSENMRHLETWQFEYGYVLKFTPSDVSVLVDVTVGMQGAYGYPLKDGISIGYVESDKNQRKKGLPQFGNINVAAAYGSFTPNGWNRGSMSGSYTPGFWDKLSYKIGIKKRGSMGASYRVGLDTQSFSFDDGSTIILTPVRPDHFGPERGLLVDAIANANDLDINILYETKEGNVNKAESHSRSGSYLISTIQKPKPMIQRTFRLRSIKKEDLKRIAVEYRRFKGISFKNVALKPNVKTNVQIEAIGAITTKK